MEEKSEYYGRFWSPMRSLGLRLSVADILWPSHSQLQGLTAEVASHLARKDTFYSTQDLAWTLSGLGRRLRHLKDLDLSAVKVNFNSKDIAPSNSSPYFQNYRGDLGQQKAILKLDHDIASTKTPHLLLKLRGFSKNQKLPPAKGALRVSRRYLNSQGKEVSLNQLKAGELIVAEVTLQNTSSETVNNFALVDRIASAFEIENPNLGRGRKLGWMPSKTLIPEYVDRRDDRVQLFGKIARNKTLSYYYAIRVAHSGQFNIPPASVEEMYQPENKHFAPSKKVSISR